MYQCLRCMKLHETRVEAALCCPDIKEIPEQNKDQAIKAVMQGIIARIGEKVKREREIKG